MHLSVRVCIYRPSMHLRVKVCMRARVQVCIYACGSSTSAGVNLQVRVCIFGHSYLSTGVNVSTRAYVHLRARVCISGCGCATSGAALQQWVQLCIYRADACMSRVRRTDNGRLLAPRAKRKIVARTRRASTVTAVVLCCVAPQLHSL